jgi:hypothetical protein
MCHKNIKKFFILISHLIDLYYVICFNILAASKYHFHNYPFQSINFVPFPHLLLVRRMLLCFSCSLTGLLLLGKTLILYILHYSCQFSRPKLSSRRPDRQHSVQRDTSSFLLFQRNVSFVSVRTVFA